MLCVQKKFEFVLKRMSFEENLIILIKEHDFLYNLKLKGYKNVLKRASTWENIAKQLNRSVDECKTRWKSLRDRFVKERRKLELPSGSGALFDKDKWEFYDLLEFLIPSLSTRRQTGNYAAEANEKDEEGNHLPDHCFCPETLENLETSMDSSVLKRGNKRKSQEVLSDFLGGLKKTVTDHLQDQNRPSLDADEQFMLTMARKMKPLPECNKISLHAKIFDEINQELLKHYT